MAPPDAAAAERVEFVDEDDARGRLARLLEQIAHPRGADADEHFHELGAGDREEGNAGLARHRPRQQRLSGSRRADQQNALGHARAEPAVGLGVLQERHDLLQLEFALLDARHVLERDLGVGLDIDLRVRLADRHHSAEPLFLGHSAEQKVHRR